MVGSVERGKQLTRNRVGTELQTETTHTHDTAFLTRKRCRTRFLVPTYLHTSETCRYIHTVSTPSALTPLYFTSFD